MAGRRPLRTWVAIAAILIEVTATAAWLGARASRTLARSWAARVAVVGESMAPTLLGGDWLLVDPDAYRGRSPMVGELVLVPDPRSPRRLLVKRVTKLDADGSVHVEGDAAGVSTDSRAFGSVDPATIEGRPWFRYWPLSRVSRVR